MMELREQEKVLQEIREKNAYNERCNIEYEVKLDNIKNRLSEIQQQAEREGLAAIQIDINRMGDKEYIAEVLRKVINLKEAKTEEFNRKTDEAMRVLNGGTYVG